MRRFFIAVVMATLAALPAQAQSVEDIIGKYTGPNSAGYLGPLADYLGATLQLSASPVWIPHISCPSGE